MKKKSNFHIWSQNSVTIHICIIKVVRIRICFSNLESKFCYNPDLDNWSCYDLNLIFKFRTKIMLHSIFGSTQSHIYVQIWISWKKKMQKKKETKKKSRKKKENCKTLFVVVWLNFWFLLWKLNQTKLIHITFVGFSFISYI